MEAAPDKNIVTDARPREWRVVNVEHIAAADAPLSDLIWNDTNNCSRHLSRPLASTRTIVVLSSPNMCESSGHTLKWHRPSRVTISMRPEARGRKQSSQAYTKLILCVSPTFWAPNGRRAIECIHTATTFALITSLTSTTLRPTKIVLFIDLVRSPCPSTSATSEN